jgi:hypothetical protein
MIIKCIVNSMYNFLIKSCLGSQGDLDTIFYCQKCYCDRRISCSSCADYKNFKLPEQYRIECIWWLRTLEALSHNSEPVEERECDIINSDLQSCHEKIRQSYVQIIITVDNEMWLAANRREKICDCNPLLGWSWPEIILVDFLDSRLTWNIVLSIKWLWKSIVIKHGKKLF